MDVFFFFENGSLMIQPLQQSYKFHYSVVPKKLPEVTLNPHSPPSELFPTCGTELNTRPGLTLFANKMPTLALHDLGGWLHVVHADGALWARDWSGRWTGLDCDIKSFKFGSCGSFKTGEIFFKGFNIIINLGHLLPQPHSFMNNSLLHHM